MEDLTILIANTNHYKEGNPRSKKNKEGNVFGLSFISHLNVIFDKINVDSVC
jgi:hypothetical protein